MAPGKSARKKKQRVGGAAKPKARPARLSPSRDPDSPPSRLRRFIEQTLREDPALTLPGLLDALNAWAKLGHTHLGYALWGGEKPFGPHYIGRLLQEDWARKLGSNELRHQARYFRDNPDKDLDDLARETRARLEALRARDAARRERQAREAAEKAERRKKAEAERAERERAERERRERERKEREQKQAEEARKRYLAALGHIVDFFQAAGIEAKADGRTARVAGVVVTPSKAQVASQPKLNELIDEVVWTHHRDALLGSITTHLPGADELRAVGGTRGWILSRDRAPIVVIRATSAKVRSQPCHEGNYLTSTNGWTQIGGEIAVIREQEIRIERSKQRLFSELPDSLDEPRRELALVASQQLRTERNLVFGHTVELQYEGGAVRFNPIRQGPLHLELPITWTRWSESATAELRIGARRDPLHLSFRGEDDDPAVVQGWVLALVAYADLVCREDLDALFRPRARPTLPPRPPSPQPPHTREVTGNGARRSAPGLKALGSTRRWIKSYVAGHRRRLRPGHHASPEARARAARLGIALREGETWVSPHVRGLPHDALLQFHWEAPAELRLGGT